MLPLFKSKTYIQGHDSISIITIYSWLCSTSNRLCKIFFLGQQLFAETFLALLQVYQSYREWPFSIHDYQPKTLWTVKEKLMEQHTLWPPFWTSSSELHLHGTLLATGGFQISELKSNLSSSPTKTTRFRWHASTTRLGKSNRSE